MLPFDYEELEWEHDWRSDSSQSADISETVDRNIPDVDEPQKKWPEVKGIPALRLKRNSTSSFRVVKSSTRSDDGIHDGDTVHNPALFNKTTLSADDVSLGVPFAGPITELSIGDARAASTLVLLPLRLSIVRNHQRCPRTACPCRNEGS